MGNQVPSIEAAAAAAMVHLSKIPVRIKVGRPAPPPPSVQQEVIEELDDVMGSVYGSRYAATDLPAHEMPEGQMPKDVAYRLISDELSLDGNPKLNLASFVTTYMEEEAERLMTECLPKNFIDYEEYPQCAAIQTKCVSIIGNLFHASEGASIGTSTVGSSEAIMLAVLALKRRWREKRKAAGKPHDNPNIVFSAAVQVRWEKAARYFDVEEKLVYCSKGRYVIDSEETVSLCDENTIGICAILGTTYTGEYEDVKGVNDLLVQRKMDVPIHVDAASGGFVTPFVVPELEWDFRCEKVFNINYLGAEQASFTLNFSKGASQVIGQYYQLIRLGKKGYRAIMTNLTRTADYLSDCLEKQDFVIMSQRAGKGLPLVAFRFKEDEDRGYDEFTLARTLRSRGWVVPAYTMAPKTENLKMLRVVVREDFSREKCELLLQDIALCIRLLETMDREQLARHEKFIQNHVTAHGRGGEGHEKYKNEKHSLQGKTGKTHAIC